MFGSVTREWLWHRRAVHGVEYAAGGGLARALRVAGRAAGRRASPHHARLQPRLHRRQLARARQYLPTLLLRTTLTLLPWSLTIQNLENKFTFTIFEEKGSDFIFLKLLLEITVANPGCVLKSS